MITTSMSDLEIYREIVGEQGKIDFRVMRQGQKAARAAERSRERPFFFTDTYVPPGSGNQYVLSYAITEKAGRLESFGTYAARLETGEGLIYLHAAPPENGRRGRLIRMTRHFLSRYRERVGLEGVTTDEILSLFMSSLSTGIVEVDKEGILRAAGEDVKTGETIITYATRQGIIVCAKGPKKVGRNEAAALTDLDVETFVTFLSHDILKHSQKVSVAKGLLAGIVNGGDVTEEEFLQAIQQEKDELHSALIDTFREKG